MDAILDRTAQRAAQELERARERAARESWDLDRVEREKSLIALRHEVTLCSTPGCLRLASAVPGFQELALLCPTCQQGGSVTL